MNKTASTQRHRPALQLRCAPFTLALSALSLAFVLSSCAAPPTNNLDTAARNQPAPNQPTTLDKVPHALSAFAGMVGGEWRMVVQSGMGMFDTWHWGPGRHSLRVMTHGESAASEPWRELSVIYWHPARKQVCRLGIGPYQRSISEGTITFDGQTATGRSDLYQTSVHRKMGLRWTFDGPDKYHDVLLEDSGAGLQTLAEWDRVRATTLTPVSPPPADKLPKFPERLNPLESLHGHTWESTGHPQGAWKDAADLLLRSTVEWVPYADGIYIRVIDPRNDGETAHLLDTYLYHHTGTSAVRCLVLSNHGGVYEGDFRKLNGGEMQLELTGYEGETITQYLVRLDVNTNESLRLRLWSFEGAARTLMLDTHHSKLESAKK